MRTVTLHSQDGTIIFTPVKKLRLKLRNSITLNYEFEKAATINHLLKKVGRGPVLDRAETEVMKNLYTGLIHQMFGGDRPQEVGFKFPKIGSKTIFGDSSLKIMIMDHVKELPTEFIYNVFDKPDQYVFERIDKDLVENKDLLIKTKMGIRKTVMATKEEIKSASKIEEDIIRQKYAEKMAFLSHLVKNR